MPTDHPATRLCAHPSCGKYADDGSNCAECTLWRLELPSGPQKCPCIARAATKALPARRERIATAALTGLLSADVNDVMTTKRAVELAIDHADALIAALDAAGAQS